MFIESLRRIDQYLLPAGQIPPLAGSAMRACQQRQRLPEQERRAFVPEYVPAGDGSALEQQRRVHVRLLTAALTDAETAENIQSAVNSIHSLLNMASWTDVSVGDPFRYDPCGIYDSALIETCLVLATALNQLRGALEGISPLLPQRIETELRRRMGPMFISGSPVRKSLSLDDACRLFSAVLLGIADMPMRRTAIGRLLEAVEQGFAALPVDGSHPGGLEQGMRTACTLMDLMEVISAATGGRVNFTGNKYIAAMADYLLYSHLHSGWFFNPGNHDMQPDFDAESLFRFGCRTGDGALCGLAAAMMTDRREYPAPDALSRVLNRTTAQALAESFGRWQMLENGYMPDAALMLMRIKYMRAILTGGTGSDHADAGSLCLFWKNIPVLIDIGGDAAATQWHTAAVIGGVGQLARLSPAKTETDFQPEGSDSCSVNLARAYPPQACISDYQRTLMLGNAAYVPSMRLMDQIDLTEPKAVDFHFICAENPEEAPDGIVIGPVLLKWNQSLSASVETLQWGARSCYRLTLHSEPAMQHHLLFEFVPN